MSTPVAARFAALFAGEVDPSLDRVAATIALLDPDAPDEAAMLGELDHLAAEATAAAAGGEAVDAVDALMTHLFGTVGLAGATTTYYDPANSYLHRVLERRRGIPITLAVVVIEVGRRLGMQLSGVGMPGHFLVGDGPEPQRWFDPFAGGRPLSRAGCRALFAQLHSGAELDDEWLRPVGSVDIANRMLQNLRLIHLRAGDPSQLIPVLELRAELPVSTLADQVELATVLGRMGRHEAAAAQRERLARLDPAQAATHLRAAYQHRASRN
jgi:regulator of sirC expression with transglutaminase-like and TPR domain